MDTTSKRQGTPIGLLKAVFTSKFTPVLFDGAETHDAANRLVAQMAQHTQDERLILRIVEAALPASYLGNTLTEVPAMLRGAVKKNFQRQRKKQTKNDEGGGSAAELLLAQIESSGIQLFHNQFKQAFMSMPRANGTAENVMLNSTAAKAKFRHLLFKHSRRIVSEQTLKACISTLEAIALHERPLETLHLRIARVGETIIVELGRADGQVIAVDKKGWAATFDSAARFYRPNGYGELPLPERGKLDDLRKLLRFDESLWLQILGFLITCFRPGTSFMCLLIEGEQGSGKSLLATMIKSIVDPSAAPKLRLPETVRDLMIHAQEMFLPNFDNASGVRNEVSDALCSMLTGGGFATRRLYTDDELIVFEAARPIIINGITDVVHRPDLLDRAISASLPSMPEKDRRSEEEILREFQRIRAGVFGQLLDCVSCALRNEGAMSTPPGFRMADCARWIAAAEPATGLPKGTILGALKSAQNELVADRVTNDPVVIAIGRLVDGPSGSGRPIEGLVSAIYESISEERDRYDKFFPTTPQHFSRYLARMVPAMRKIGLLVQYGARTREGRKIRIWREGQEKQRVVQIHPRAHLKH